MKRKKFERKYIVDEFLVINVLIGFGQNGEEVNMIWGSDFAQFDNVSTEETVRKWRLEG